MFNASLNNGNQEKVGTIKAWGGSTPPYGWLLCDGSAISRTLYAELFAVIGTTYGAGDGTTTFNLPNGVVPIGTASPLAGNNRVTLAGSGGRVTAMQTQGGYYMSNTATKTFWLDSGTWQEVPTSNPIVMYELYKGGVTSYYLYNDLTQATAASPAIIKY